MDFPQSQILPTHLHTVSTDSSLSAATSVTATAVSMAAFAWPANKQAIYIPIIVRWAYPVRRVFWTNGSTITSTNADFGIYTTDGSRLYHTGSTAMSGASVPQYVTPTAFILSPGVYYFALAMEGETLTARGNGVASVAEVQGKMAGLMQQATAFPLPETATFASWTSTGFQCCGVTKTSAGF